MQFQPKRDVFDRVCSVVLAGGQGTRLSPLTESRCKPAVSFGGRYRLIDIPLSNSLNSRINHIFVISQYLANSLHSHIQRAYPSSFLADGKIEVLAPERDEMSSQYYRGTADAVRKNLEILSETQAEYFLILSGDQLYNMDFSKMIAFAEQTDADLVIATQPVVGRDASRMGLMKVDNESKVIDFVEKPKDPAILEQFALQEKYMIQNELKMDEKLYLGSMGIYVFKRSCLFSILEMKGDDFGKHIIPQQMKRGNTYAYLYGGYWEDIGTISSFYRANLALMHDEKCLDLYNEKMPIFTTPSFLPSPIIEGTLVHNCLINHGAVIRAKEITSSVIGMRAFVDRDTVIRESIIMGNSQAKLGKERALNIGRNCLIEKTIIDEGASIGNFVSLINKDKLNHYDGDGIFIRDGIIVVASGTHLPDHFSL